MKLFVAGTDTGVGKTFVTTAITDILLKKGKKVGLIKWASTGASKKSLDIEYIAGCLKDAFGDDILKNLEISSPYCLSFPASPHLAAELEGVEIDTGKILDETRKLEEKNDFLIIEGVGGLMVPIKRNLLLIDLLKKSGATVVLVARAGLGTLNHTLLSIEALNKRGIPLCGIVLNNNQPVDEDDRGLSPIIEDNKRTISEFSGLKVIGPLPFCHSPLDNKVTSIVNSLFQ